MCIYVQVNDVCMCYYTSNAYNYTACMLVICFANTYVAPPTVSEVTATRSQTPADLCGFDITIFWNVSRLRV